MMIRLPLLLALLSAACGSSDITSMPGDSSVAPDSSVTRVFAIEVDSQDYGAVDFGASLTSTGAGPLLILSGARPQDPLISDDEFGLYAWIRIDDIAQRSAGDTIHIDAVSSFDVEPDATRSVPYGVTTVGRGNHDPAVRHAHVRQGCFCAPYTWADQTITATITLTSVSSSGISGDIDLRTTGGIPYYDYVIGAEPPSHTSRFHGAFTTQ